MLVAIFSVHWQNGFFMSNNGYEFALALLAATLALATSGAGKMAVDNFISKKFQ
jgi:putative oxidoreductase